MVNFILKTIFICSAVLIISGCQSIKDKKTIFSALYLVGELKSWEDYAKQTNGFSRSSGNLQDQNYVRNRLDKEYLAYIDKMEHLASGNIVDFFRKKSGTVTKALEKENVKLDYKIDKLITLTNNQTNRKFGYCVTFKVNMDGSKDDDISFAYFDVNKDFSILASGDDFVNKLCGNKFYIEPKKK